MFPLLFPPGAWCTLTLEAPVSPKPLAGCTLVALFSTPHPMRLSTNSPFLAARAAGAAGSLATDEALGSRFLMGAWRQDKLDAYNLILHSPERNHLPSQS
uniref:Uncharacterized protein n=1 Tax=Guillardia theta TaxID=55529 RepID=A0A7S4M0U9_GUITH